MQFKFSEKLNNRLMLAADAAAALLFSVSFVVLWGSSLELEWSPRDIVSGNPLRGMLSVWNQMADEMGRSVYLILPRFGGGVGNNGEALPQGSFLTLAVLFLAILVFLMIRSRVRVWLAIFVIPVLLLMFCTGLTPRISCMLIFIFALALVWSQMGAALFRQGTAATAVMLALLLTAGTGFLCNRILPFEPAQITDRTGAAIERLLHTRYGSGALNNGRLNALSGKEQAKARGKIGRRIAVLGGTGKDKTGTALQIKGKELESYYLRGYVGERYKGDHWDRLKTSVYYDARDDMYWLNKAGFDGLSQESGVAKLLDGEIEKKTLSIKVKKGDRSQLYIPYEMVGTDKKLPKGSRNYAGGFLESSRLLGSREYKLTCMSNMTGMWTDWVGELYSTGYSPEQTQYFTNESHYNVWCYQKDTEVPEKLKEQLSVELGDPGDPYSSHKGYKEAISITQDYLAQNFSYSDKFKPLKRKKDFLLNFLKKRKGCDVHYASLATMIFRYYRIPARYVEGYLLTPTDVAEGKGKVNLGQSHQHAWTEIYVDGYGWVPIEVTPEYRGIMDEADMETGLESVSYDGSALQETPPPEPDEEKDTRTLHAIRKQLRKLALIIGLVLLGLILLVILAVAGWKGWKIWKRTKSFNHPDPKHGICAMYGYMIEERLPLSETAVSIGDAAAFSQFPMDEKQRTTMKDELDLARVKGKRIRKEEMRKRLPWIRRTEL